MFGCRGASIIKFLGQVHISSLLKIPIKSMNSDKRYGSLKVKWRSFDCTLQDVYQLQKLRSVGSRPLGVWSKSESEAEDDIQNEGEAKRLRE